VSNFLQDAARRPSVRIACVLVAVLLGALGCGSDDEGTAGDGAAPDDSIPVSEAPDSTASTELPDSGSTPEEATSLDGVEVQLTPVAEGQLDSAIALATREGTDDLYVAERAGRVQVLTPDGDGGYDVADEPLVDISDNVSSEAELGLLGVTFSPDGSRLYLSHSDADQNTRLVEYTMDGDQVDLASERELVYLEDPFANHNGGQITFGPDGYLYYALGDGGGGGDPLSSGQDPDQLFGKILRLDPTAGSGDVPYGVPADNPFVDGGGRPEVYLYGVRNPWRFAFDRATEDLWVADVGQNEYEEISLLPAADGGAGLGANLGWSELEGTHPFDGGTEPEGAVGPIFEYAHSDGGCSVTGGYVYRGEAIPELYGTYVYGDYCVGDVRGLVEQDGEVLDEGSLGLDALPGSLVSFGEDADGELYVISSTEGLLRVDPA
jgi:glucose/arabinose dehydrogenase